MAEMSLIGGGRSGGDKEALIDKLIPGLRFLNIYVLQLDTENKRSAVKWTDKICLLSSQLGRRAIESTAGLS